MNQAHFQNTLRKGKREKKKKALHRGTFEVVKTFSFQYLAPARERERVHVSVFHSGIGAVGVLRVHPCAGTSGMQALRTGTSASAEPAGWHVGDRAHGWLCTCLWLCSHLQSVAEEHLWPWRGHVSLCVRGFPSRQLAQGCTQQLQWPFRPKDKGSCLMILLPVVLLGIILSKQALQQS